MKKYQNKQPIFAISGPSASGKGSVWAPLRDRSDDFVISVSHTTRPPRERDVHGVDYNFVDDQVFDEIINSDDFLEWEHVHEHRYGTRKSDFLRLVDSDKKVIIEIDVNGAEFLKKMFQQVVTIFITPSDIKEAHRRLESRNTESKASIEIRKKRYQMELEKAKKYDHIIFNDNLEVAQSELDEIVNKY